MSSSKIVATQRFSAGVGPVTAIAASIPFLGPRTTLHPQGPSGNGLLPDPIGLPWRSAPYGLEVGEDSGKQEAGNRPRC